MQPRTSSEWQTYLRYRRDQTLDELYRLQPQDRWEVMKSKGYAAFKGGDAGVALSGAIAVAPGVKVYQLTESGLALQATVHGDS